MKNLRLSFLFLLLFASYTSFAQQKKEWHVRLRGLGIIPQESASIGVIGGDAHVNNAYVPELDFTYFFAKNLSAELILGTSRHKVNTFNSNLAAIGGSTAANVDLGKVWLLPPTLTLQYHIPTKTLLRPYVGSGVNYTIFYNANQGLVVKDVKYDNKFAFATQAGVDIDISKKMFINIDVKKIFLNTNARVDASNLTPAASPALAPVLQNINADVKIRPWVIGLGIGCRL